MWTRRISEESVIKNLYLFHVTNCTDFLYYSKWMQVVFFVFFLYILYYLYLRLLISLDNHGHYGNNTFFFSNQYNIVMLCFRRTCFVWSNWSMMFASVLLSKMILFLTLCIYINPYPKLWELRESVGFVGLETVWDKLGLSVYNVCTRI